MSERDSLRHAAGRNFVGGCTVAAVHRWVDRNQQLLRHFQ
jgi:hypothetical protein